MENNPRISTPDIDVIKIKLQILYTYSLKYNKKFKTLIVECSNWDQDCKYALNNPSIHNLNQFI